VGGSNPERRPPLILATVKVEDVDRFLATFTTKGAEKRKEHGSGGSHVFRDPNDDTRVWVVFEWDEDGYGKLLSDPDMPAVFEEAGLHGRPEHGELLGEYEA
jgi:quinol monooxygenase YgiN